jgi:Transglycosylase SLT domain
MNVAVPSILVASIAMQESTCNPSTVGGAGEQGIMQITEDKCGGAPGGDCKDLVRKYNFGLAQLMNTVSSGLQHPYWH